MYLTHCEHNRAGQRSRLAVSAGMVLHKIKLSHVVGRRWQLATAVGMFRYAKATPMSAKAFFASVLHFAAGQCKDVTCVCKSAVLVQWVGGGLCSEEACGRQCRVGAGSAGAVLWEDAAAA